MDQMQRQIFDRTRRLVGDEQMEKLARKKVILFGVGGVGSWCAEGLIRGGIGHLTIVDPDCVSVTNINRQLMATTRTVGRVKVEVLRERLPSRPLSARKPRPISTWRHTTISWIASIR